MARSLVLSNGSLHVGIDRFALIRDFYFDYVGLEDHMSKDSVHLVGVWVENQGGGGQLSWLNEPGWQIDIDYHADTMAGVTIAKNDALNIELNIIDLVYNESPIFIRKFIVNNHTQSKRNIKIYLNHQFSMYGIASKDTVYFDPEDNTIMHYKGRRIALIGGLKGKESFTDYTVGLSGIEGKQGTWKDAEDGRLDQNPVEHGAVDSTICFEDTPDSKSSFEFTYWIAIEKTMDKVKALHKYILSKSPEHLIETTQDFWNAWLNKTNFDYLDLSKEVQTLFKRSLLIVRTHVDNTGGIIASSDSEMLQLGRDNYSYIWPRDAAYVAIALAKAGYPEVSKKFFEFANLVISEDGYFFHKFRSDKSWGSSWHPWIVDGVRQLPIQEDETALVLIALWEHYSCSKDLEFIENIYNSLIKKAGNFMLGFRNETKLPFPSYDLWEMKFGINSFTSAVVAESLDVVARFAKLLGKDKDEELYTKGAQELRQAIRDNFFNKNNNYFYKLIEMKDGKTLHDEIVDASSFYGMFNYNIYDINDPILDTAHKIFLEKLRCAGEHCGIVRFEQDVYYRADSNSPGNPWIITTLWLAQYYIKKANQKDGLKQALDIINWVTAHALPSGILSEQINPINGSQLSAGPLAWSHAEFVTTVLLYLDKLKQLNEK
jgi:GH15 family glucan-1,4-alpha-glucosidase